MELLVLLLLTFAVGIILFKPHKRRLSFGLFIGAFCLALFMQGMAWLGAILPAGTY